MRHGYGPGWRRSRPRSRCCLRPGTLDDWSASRRRERRLGELGAVRCDVARGGRTLQQALESFYELEARGWKGHSGSAVAQRPRVKRFYDRLVEHAAADGGVWIPTLALSDT